jgi:pimeloyl-ACP methyl ester carboxylesterase
MIARRVEAAVPPIGSFAELGGDRIHYIDRGSGPPIVMIHGLGGVLQNFTHSLVDRLTDRFRVIALDRPGAGYSVRGRGHGGSIWEQAATITRLIERLQLERPLVVGHSLGGAIALALAANYPHVARALALIAPLTQPEDRAPRAFRGLEIPSPLVRAVIAHTIAVPMSILRGADAVRLIFSPEPVSPDFGTAGGGLLSLRASQFYNASTDMMAVRHDMPGLIARYGQIATPVSVLFGAQDAILDPGVHGEAFRTQVRHARLELVAGGHMLPVTQPELVARWLSRL